MLSRQGIFGCCLWDGQDILGCCLWLWQGICRCYLCDSLDRVFVDAVYDTDRVFVDAMWQCRQCICRCCLFMQGICGCCVIVQTGCFFEAVCVTGIFVDAVRVTVWRWLTERNAGFGTTICEHDSVICVLQGNALSEPALRGCGPFGSQHSLLIPTAHMLAQRPFQVQGLRQSPLIASP